MADREALAAALKDDLWTPDSPLNYEPWEEKDIAARERLAQLPETCGTCGGNGKLFARNKVAVSLVDGTFRDTCPSCHGTGKVYPPETVERIAQVLCATHGGINYIGERDYQLAVAVLDALNGEAQ